MTLLANGLPRFGRGNSKLPDSTLTFALPSGFTCPGALLCLSMAERNTGTLVDGPETQFRCFEASVESRYSSVRRARWRNFELIQGLEAAAMGRLLHAGLQAALQHKSTHVRWFTGGDCFSVALRDAIIHCATSTPQLIHYLYTKNIPLFLDHRPRPIELPGNLRVTGSWGGKFDHLLVHLPRTARVLANEEEAQALGLQIDFTDQLAWQDEPTHFCHLVHGVQPKGSRYGREIRARRDAGRFSGYSHNRRRLAAALTH
jgi:hypothetical protein